MVQTHSLGFPRIGRQREMKFALEAYWQGELSEEELMARGQQIRHDNWAMQSAMGIDLLPVGDFSWYDHMLDMSVMLGVVPERFQHQNDLVSLTTYFQMARGQADTQACAMTKWFDTNYHYIVPELQQKQIFKLAQPKLFMEIQEAQAQGHRVKPVLIGPLTYLYLSRTYPQQFDKLSLLPQLLTAYLAIFAKLTALKIAWVQIDEPILVLDLPAPWRQAFHTAYESFKDHQPNILLTTYFGSLDDNIDIACQLPVAGLHIDGIAAQAQIAAIIKQRQPERILSMGIIDGRNIWRANLQEKLQLLEPLHQQLQDKLWIANSCSFLHCPIDLDMETALDKEIKPWLAFAKQKTKELTILAQALNQGKESVAADLAENQHLLHDKASSPRIHHHDVKQRMASMAEIKLDRHPYSKRRLLQQRKLALPLLPTTTIGSFPQTAFIRQSRQDLKKGKITQAAYIEMIQSQIQNIIHKQEELGLDVLVHGEPERNDMVEYFAEQLAGFIMTQNGWVQSYGSRCVKPPIIYGDIFRTHAMSLSWSQYAQSLTTKPVKGMLTGPVTMVMWSFVRDDQSRYLTMQQMALALRDEVQDLEEAGIGIIQIDEPAFREGLPLRRKQWTNYLTEAIHCFKLAANVVQDSTQIHTHMCYSEFNDIIEAIAQLDADVISIETSRSHMELLESFKTFRYPNGIGPGVYDVHSPRVAPVAEIKALITKAAQFIAIENLWVNPDCGLKTRSWPEVEESLRHMVDAAHLVRNKITLVEYDK
jgi:5-methyltetrahydropteroyltriglutamate--homocysteine methyltransferase